MYCKDCRDWERENPVVGLCTTLTQVSDELIKRQDEQASLYTPDNFGCVHFKKKGPFFENIRGGLSVNLDNGNFDSIENHMDIKKLVRWLNKVLE